MNDISPQQLLDQIRTLGNELQVGPAAEPKSGEGFGNVLKSTLEGVNELQQTSSQMRVDFETGASDASLAEVMIAAQKSSLSFRAVTEVRNKLITAYQDIMNMPV